MSKPPYGPEPLCMKLLPPRTGPVPPDFDEPPSVHTTSTVQTSNTEQHYSNISTNPFIKNLNQ